jgi:elongation factor Ts
MEVMNITNEMIKNLREKTGAGMMDCKRALEATGGSIEGAIEYLRKKGAAVGQKRADRTAKEGAIVTRVASDGKIGVVVEINCETDFVARSEDFLDFANTVAEAIERHRPQTLEKIHTLPTPAGKTVSQLLNDLLAKVGEKIEIRRFALFESNDGALGSYTHLGSKIGVLVELTGVDAQGARTGAGRDVAMQVAAMNPLVVSRDQVEKTLIERELDIYRTQAKNEGKPAHIVDKIAMGRLEKFYQEICLLEQTFIRDAGKMIKDYLQEVGTAAGKPVTVKRFQRYHLGEENT